MRKAVIENVRKETEEIKALKERSKSARWKTQKKGGSIDVTTQDTDPLDERLAFLEATLEDMEKDD